jgi:hypothetical protein
MSDRSPLALGVYAPAQPRAWRVAMAESVRLADEFAALVAAGSVQVEPLP